MEVLIGALIPGFQGGLLAQIESQRKPGLQAGIPLNGLSLPVADRIGNRRKIEEGRVAVLVNVRRSKKGERIQSEAAACPQVFGDGPVVANINHGLQPAFLRQDFGIDGGACPYGL